MRAALVPLVLIVGCVALGQRADAYITPRAYWGSYGTGNYQFNGPRAIAADPTGKYVYVADTGNGRIQKYRTDGTYITQWTGSGGNQLTDPYGVTTDDSGNVYVSDRLNNRVERFDPIGTYLSTIGSGTLNHPRGLQWFPDGSLFVADSDNNRVVKFDATGGVANTIAETFPTDVALDPSGNVFIALPTLDRIDEYDPSGSLIQAYGSPGTALGSFDQPNDVTVDAAGNLFVSDFGNNRIQEFSLGFNFRRAYGSGGAGIGDFDGPLGLVTDGNGSIFVVDSGNDRVQKFDFMTPDTFISGPSGLISDNTPTFTLTSDSTEAGVQFSCRVDHAAVASICPSSYTPTLSDGFHNIQVTATDADGTDATPAERDVQVDTRAPIATITGNPPAVTTDRTPTFRFVADEPSTFACMVDATTTSCSSPFTTAALALGNHTFRVAATDAAGNTGPPDTFTFRVKRRKR